MARAVGGDEVRADALSATALVEQAGAGCEGSWQELVDRHLPLVAAVCTAHGLTPAGSAEVNQVVWLRLAERLLHIREPEGLGDWIAARTRALCLDVRWSGARRGDVVADLPPPPGPPPGPARHGPEVAFARVGVRCQRVLRLAALTPAPADGEVGAALDLAADEVRRSCARCLQRLGRMTGRSPDAVLPELRAALARHPGVPGEWQAASHAAFVWLLLDVPFAERTFRSTRRGGGRDDRPDVRPDVRAHGPPVDDRVVHEARYEVGGDGVELTLEVKHDDVVLSGRVCCGTPTKVVVRWPGGERVDGTDDAGAFRVYDLPHAPLCVQLDGAVTLKTGWMVP